MPDSRFSRRALDRILISGSIALGLVHSWVGRDSMDLDGVSYLDLGDALSRHDWANAVNAWWGPLYAWLVGLLLGIVKPSPKWEFPLVHAVNFVIFLVALFSFRSLIHSILQFRQERNTTDPQTAPLPEWALLLGGYAIFLWASLEIVGIYLVSPDLAVLACLCLAASILLRLPTANIGRFAIFGLVLGVGYWVKAILFPLGLIWLVCAYCWRRRSRGWGPRITLATVVFLLTSAPLVAWLSAQKGRFTFGDTGRLNYARYVSPQMPWTNWQGEIPEGGRPVHPTRQLLRHPPIFEYDGPIIGTYPPWTDPSYWNEGVQWHFRLKPQLEVLLTTVPSEIRVLLRSQPGLLVGVIVLALLSGRLWLTGLGQLWPLIAVSLIGMALYLPLVVNDRYLGGFVLVLFLTFLAAVRLRERDVRTTAYIVVAVFFVMMVGSVDVAVRYATHHLANPGAGPESTREDLVAAQGLRNIGVRPGDKVAIIGGTGIYWARLAKLRIIAEVGGGRQGAEEFWALSPEMKQLVYEVFERIRAKRIVALCPSSSAEGWDRIERTNYCTFSLP